MKVEKIYIVRINISQNILRNIIKYTGFSLIVERVEAKEKMIVYLKQLFKDIYENINKMEDIYHKIFYKF